MEEEEKLEEPKLKPKKCPRCGYVNSADAKYCNNCGLIVNAELAMKTQEFRRIRDDVLLNRLFGDPEFIEFVTKKLRELGEIKG